VEPAFTANDEHDSEQEAERAKRIIEAWRRANPRYDGFVTRIHAVKRLPSIIQGAAP
jgi:hypothetical protein